MRTCAAAIVSLLVLACGSCASRGEAPAPSAGGGGAERAGLLVPLNTNFWSYWTHYWATWLPDHPVYEMIELTAYENPRDPDDLFLRVFLTERAGRKQQYFYLNDEGEAERSRANAFYRDIAYRRTGPEDGPQDLHVAFTDKDGVPIEWTIRFDESAALREHGDGLTPSIHSLGAIMLFALRTRTVDTHDDRVLFAGQDFAHAGAADNRAPGTRSWFNPDYYSAILLFGGLQFTQEDGVLSNSWGRTFTPVAGNPAVYRSGELGPENFVQFEVDDAGALKSYAHFSRGHSLNFTFDPPLPPIRQLEHGTQVRFSAAFDGGRSLMTGDVRVHRTSPELIVLEWTPRGPEWAVGRNFYSVIRPQDAGYELTLTDNRAVAFPEGPEQGNAAG